MASNGTDEATTASDCVDGEVGGVPPAASEGTSGLHIMVAKNLPKTTKSTSPRKKRHRTKFTREQVAAFRELYEISDHPSRDEVGDLSSRLDLEYAIVKQWFDNRRYNDRHRPSRKQQEERSIVQSSPEQGAEEPSPLEDAPWRPGQPDDRKPPLDSLENVSLKRKREPHDDSDPTGNGESSQFFTVEPTSPTTDLRFPAAEEGELSSAVEEAPAPQVHPPDDDGTSKKRPARSKAVKLELMRQLGLEEDIRSEDFDAKSTCFHRQPSSSGKPSNGERRVSRGDGATGRSILGQMESRSMQHRSSPLLAKTATAIRPQPVLWSSAMGWANRPVREPMEYWEESNEVLHALPRNTAYDKKDYVRTLLPQFLCLIERRKELYSEHDFDAFCVEVHRLFGGLIFVNEANLIQGDRKLRR